MRGMAVDDLGRSPWYSLSGEARPSHMHVGSGFARQGTVYRRLSNNNQ